MKRVTVVATIALAFGAGAVLAAQQRQDDRELLRLLASGPSRARLPADTLAIGDDGELQPAVRCATRVPSELERELVARVATTARGPRAVADPAAPLTIDVVFHVVRSGDGGYNVPARQVRQQVRLLNRSFRDYGFAFRKAKVQRYRDNRFARHCDDFEVERDFKAAHAVAPDTTLNVYTCRPADGSLGWATFPWSPAGNLQGVVALHSSFPGGGAGPYDEGDTVVHETGHWLGLYHTFHGGCSARGDDVDDTPAQASPTFGCPDERDSCGQRPGVDPIHNFMDYSDDRCMTEFTPGQGQRMRDVVGAFRTGLGH